MRGRDRHEEEREVANFPSHPMANKGKMGTRGREPRQRHALGRVLHSFLRSGEMTVPSDQDFDQSVHLTKKYLAVDNQTAPNSLRVHLKQSKTDPFWQGIILFVGKTGSDLCPV